MLADANKLMADARFKGMKAVASLAGHSTRITFFRSPSVPMGQHIVSGSGDKSVKVRSVSGRKEVVAGWRIGFVSPNEEHILSGSHDNLVKVWS
jgi:hypothetical protein